MSPGTGYAESTGAREARIGNPRKGQGVGTDGAGDHDVGYGSHRVSSIRIVGTSCRNVAVELSGDAGWVIVADLSRGNLGRHNCPEGEGNNQLRRADRGFQ